MNKCLKESLDTLQALLAKLFPPIMIKSKHRGRGTTIPFTPYGTGSCHYMFKHIVPKFYRDGVTGVKSAQMHEYKHKERRNMEDHIFKGRITKHKLNRHGIALRRLNLCDTILINSEAYINGQLNDIQMREKALKVGAFLPAKALAKTIIEQHKTCKTMSTVCKAKNIYSNGYLSPYKKYYAQLDANNAQQQLEEEIQNIAEENAAQEANPESISGENVEGEEPSLSREVELAINLIA